MTMGERINDMPYRGAASTVQDPNRHAASLINSGVISSSYNAQIMRQNFRQCLIDLRGRGLTAQPFAKLGFNHLKHAFHV